MEFWFWGLEIPTAKDKVKVGEMETLIFVRTYFRYVQNGNYWILELLNALKPDVKSFVEVRDSVDPWVIW